MSSPAPAANDRPASPSARKPPRRTAERILDHTLELFNRYGEPNVSTTLISAELNISPGNLYYHYPAKEALVNALVERYEQALHEALGAAGPADDAVGAWLLVPRLFRLCWDYRFLFRDLNDL
ncbi:MAG TPA: TetR/AcrR family transcriptional regulator, partial [Burkholderiaceae bacterium]|nr:TetR/AcrR family transcriptional regulator [Burkholderiaceae bacterium]